MYKKIVTICALYSMAIFSYAGPFENTLDANIVLAQKKLNLVIDKQDVSNYPHYTDKNGQWQNTDAEVWTSGFFPGELWMMYQATSDSKWMEHAKRWQENLKSQKNNTNTHDIGFKIFNSFGNAYLITKDESHHQVVLDAAQSLATRYNAKVGCIKSWDDSASRPSGFKVIIDNMMNLELLFWASQNGGNRNWHTMAVNHALKTAKNSVRADGSTYHIVTYNPSTGAVQTQGTYQGYKKDSTWARGQSWAIYGFTMSYRYTRDARFLTTARRTADWFIANLPKDSIPYWDFNVPKTASEPRDSSAAAIAASGLIELSRLETNPGLRIKYLNVAKKIISSLSSSAYLAKNSSYQSLLLHGTSFKMRGNYDTGLIYGDYYFLEAMLRYKNIR